MIAISHAATIITFDGQAEGTIPSSFASNIPDVGGISGTSVTAGQGTPNIALEWWANNAGVWGFSYDSTEATGIGVPGIGLTSSAFIHFIPEAGYSLNLGSMDFQATVPSGALGYVYHWFVLRGTSTVVSGGRAFFEYGTGPVTSPINFIGEPGVDYTLQFMLGTKTLGGAGIDNLVFSQTAVPEPAASALVLAGAAGLLGRRRRRA